MTLLHTPPTPWRRRLHQGLVSLACAALIGPAAAHGFRVGAVVVDHPYALPSQAGSPNGAMYIRALDNTGPQPEQLLGASSPVAARIEIQRAQTSASAPGQAGEALRLRPVAAVDLAPGQRLALKHGGEWHLVLVGLNAPLKAGDRFPVTLRFARAGELTVRVWVQQPRDGATGPEHAH